MLKNNKSYIFSAIIIYLLILFPSLYTPIQSDDYFYLLKGVSLEKTIAHYTGWSGRLITDFTSSFLLKYLPQSVYASINAFVFLLLIIFISLIPTFINNPNTDRKRPSTFILWLTFTAYWITNPNLGQTSFWIVGSANYLWTIMWAAAYICLILYQTNFKKDAPVFFNYLTIFILGFLAGCSNENTSVSITLFSFIILFFEIRKPLIITGLLANIIGSGILLLAPGNFVRIQNSEHWYAISTKIQIYLHTFERMPSAITAYLHIYLLLIAAAILLTLLVEKNQRKMALYATIFFVLSISANFILAKSPYIGGRNLNTGLFFLLIPLAIIVSQYQNTTLKKVKWLGNVVLISYALLFFIPSYILFSFMMIQADAQQAIRVKIIQESKDMGITNASIPSWYFTKLQKDSDKFDTYQGESMPQFYGLNEIDWVPTNFNYAALKLGDKLSIDTPSSNGITIKNLYNHKNSPFSSKKNLVIELKTEDNNTNQPLISIGEQLAVEIKDSTNNISNFIIGNEGIHKLNNMFYLELPPKRFELEQLKNLNIDVINSSNNRKRTLIQYTHP